jgi:hypothetical protein
MKKTIVLSIIYILIGFFLGELIFSDKIELIKRLQKGDMYYFIQENNKYLNVGITRDDKVLEKLKSIYKSKNIDITVKEIMLESKEFKTNVDQFDILINQTKDLDQVLTIEEVVIANYEEIIKKQ